MKITEKIAALIRKAEGTHSEHERDAFMAKANELLAKHDLAMADLVLDAEAESEDTKVGREDISYGQRMQTWNSVVLAGVGPFTNVETFRTRRRNYRKTENFASFVGRKADVQVAIDLYNSICAQIEAAADDGLTRAKLEGTLVDYFGRPVHGKTYKTNFRVAAAEVVRGRLEDLKRERDAANAETSSALMVVNQRDIQDFLNAQGVRIRTRALSMRTKSRNGQSDGRVAGQRVQLNKSLPEH